MASHIDDGYSFLGGKCEVCGLYLFSPLTLPIPDREWVDGLLRFLLQDCSYTQYYRMSKKIFEGGFSCPGILAVLWCLNCVMTLRYCSKLPTLRGLGPFALFGCYKLCQHSRVVVNRRHPQLNFPQHPSSCAALTFSRRTRLKGPEQITWTHEPNPSHARLIRKRTNCSSAKVGFNASGPALESARPPAAVMNQ